MTILTVHFNWHFVVYIITVGDEIVHTKGLSRDIQECAQSRQTDTLQGALSEINIVSKRTSALYKCTISFRGTVALRVKTHNISKHAKSCDLRRHNSILIKHNNTLKITFQKTHSFVVFRKLQVKCCSVFWKKRVFNESLLKTRRGKCISY